MTHHAKRNLTLATLITLLGLLACGGTSIVTGPTAATLTAIAGTTTAGPSSTVSPSPATATTTAVATVTTIAAPPTATHIPVAPTATPLPWDTHAFFEARPDCVKDGASWLYFNNGSSGTMTCARNGVLLTPLSTINFSGVTGKLPPTMTLSIVVSNMTTNAIASIILYLNGANSHVYYFDLYATGEWTMRRYAPETIIASGTLSPLNSATLTAIASGTTRTFQINGTTVASVNDGFTYTAASSSAISLGGTSSDSATFANLSFTP